MGRRSPLTAGTAAHNVPRQRSAAAASSDAAPTASGAIEASRPVAPSGSATAFHPSSDVAASGSAAPSSSPPPRPLNVATTYLYFTPAANPTVTVTVNSATTVVSSTVGVWIPNYNTGAGGKLAPAPILAVGAASLALSYYF